MVAHWSLQGTPPVVRRTGLLACLVAALFAMPSSCTSAVDAFRTLWLSESRTPLADMASAAPSVDQPGVVEPGTLAFVQGTLSGQATRDGALWDASTPIAIIRVTEMYAWSRIEETTSRRLWGGGREETTTVRFETHWQSDPVRGFPDEDAPSNPPLAWRTEAFSSGPLQVGAFTLDASQPILGAWRPALPPASERRGPLEGATELEGALYFGAGTPEAPVVGDYRVRYFVMDAGTELTVLASVRGDTLTSWAWYGVFPVMLALEGSRSDIEQLLSGLDKLLTWGGRALVFYLLMSSIFIVFGPLLVVADIVPPVGALVAILLGVVAAPLVALAMTLAVYGMMLAQKPILLGVILAMIGFITWAWRKAGDEIREGRRDHAPPSGDNASPPRAT